MFFGLIEPFAFLYERAFNMDEAIHEHRELEHALDLTGVRVHRLKHLAIKLAREEPELGIETIFSVLVFRPSIRLDQKRGVRMMYPRVQLDVPLANLFFIRDQQVASDLGLIVGRMSKPQRRMEPDITSTILEMAGAKIVNRVKAPGTFEGGDFIPAGKIAMI